MYLNHWLTVECNKLMYTPSVKCLKCTDEASKCFNAAVYCSITSFLFIEQWSPSHIIEFA